MTKVVLTRTAIIAMADALRTATEKLPDGMCQYIGDQNDVTIAERIAGETGLEINTDHVKKLRQEIIGRLRSHTTVKVTPGEIAELSGTVAELRGRIDGHALVIASLTQQVESLRKTLEHYDHVQHDRRAACTAALRAAIGNNRVDGRVVRTQLRGAGFSEEEVAMAMYISGLVIRQNGTGETLELRR